MPGTSRRRRAVGAAATAGLALILAACSAGASPAGPDTASAPAPAGAAGVSDATVTVGLATVPASLDFTTTGGAAIFQALMGNVYEGLVQLGDDGSVQPLLATSWKVSDDGLRYTFTLRDGVTFHDGAAFTADDVKFSLERLSQWTANTPGNLAAIDHVEVDSPTQATVVLSAPDANALFWLAGPLGAMFDPDSVASLATQANGTGPFTFVSYEQSVKMVLTRNDDYWGSPAQVKEVDLDYFADAASAANALRTGGVDALFQAEAYDQIPSFEADPAFTVTTGTTQGVVVMSMNSAHGALGDTRVRQAIATAIDKPAVLAAATAGYGTVLGGPSVPTDPYYVDTSDTYAYDPDAATALLAQADATGLSLTFTVPNRPYAQAIAQVVQSDLAAVGITVTLVPQEFPAVWVDQTMTKKNFDLTVTNHVEPRNITNYANPDYYWSYDSAPARDLFARAKAAVGDDAFTAAMKDAAALVVSDSPGVWLYNPPNVVVTRAAVSGFATNYMGVGIGLAQVGVAQ